MRYLWGQSSSHHGYREGIRTRMVRGIYCQSVGVDPTEPELTYNVDYGTSSGSFSNLCQPCFRR